MCLGAAVVVHEAVYLVTTAQSANGQGIKVGLVKNLVRDYVDRIRVDELG